MTEMTKAKGGRPFRDTRTKLSDSEELFAIYVASGHSIRSAAYKASNTPGYLVEGYDSWPALKQRVQDLVNGAVPRFDVPDAAPTARPDTVEALYKEMILENLAIARSIHAYIRQQIIDEKLTPSECSSVIDSLVPILKMTPPIIQVQRPEQPKKHKEEKPPQTIGDLINELPAELRRSLNLDQPKPKPPAPVLRRRTPVTPVCQEGRGNGGDHVDE